MKKILGLLFAVMFVFSLSLVSATTLIAGTVYHAGDITNTIEGADVVVSCAHNTAQGIVTNIQNTTSLSDGSYTVTFSEGSISGCDDGDVVIVYATTESEPKVVEDDIFGPGSGINWDFAMAHVPMVPEFGFFVGMLTILSATVVFFVVRKE